MGQVANSVEDVELLLHRIGFDKEYSPAEGITALLVDFMHYADATRGVSWARCIEAARRQHQREVAEEALTKPLPTN